MLKTRLKPYVHKIKGIKNYGLYDILNGKFYTLSTDGDVKTLKHSLLEAGLIFETEGTVPFPLSLDMSSEKERIGLRELQIRLNGCRERDCLERQKIDDKKHFMSLECLTQLKKDLTNIPVKTLRIEADTEDTEKVLMLLEQYPFQKVILFIRSVTPDLESKARKVCKILHKEITFLSIGKREKEIKELQVSAYDFFYRQHFNPCLGHQVAIDCGGEIKPCLWWPRSLGYIGKNRLTDMIISGIFDDYWERSKDRIAVCKNCERRYACNDCRVSFIPVEEDQYKDGKPTFCDYR